MTSAEEFTRPPRIAIRLVHLFTTAQDESILGDLLEEYSHIASKSGVAFARRWYWRQTLKTIGYLICTSFRTAPLSTSSAVAGGFLLRGLTGRLVEPSIFAVLQRYQIFDHHFTAYMFFASTGIDIGHLIVFLFVGCIVALGAREREMAATMSLALIFGAMTVAAFVAMVIRTGGDAFLWRMAWYFADSLAVVIGGVIVRARRSSALTLPSSI